MTVAILILVVILIIIGYFADKRRDIKERASNIELGQKELPNLVVGQINNDSIIPDIDIKNININPTKVGTISKSKNKKKIDDKRPGIITEDELFEIEEKTLSEE